MRHADGYLDNTMSVRICGPDRPDPGAAYLGLGDDPSSARPRHRSRRWPVRRRRALDRLPARVLSRFFRRRFCNARRTENLARARDHLVEPQAGVDAVDASESGVAVNGTTDHDDLSSPFVCPDCGGVMVIDAIIERHPHPWACDGP